MAKTTPIPKDYTQEWTHIQGIDFTIPYGVFIPRPETEHWMQSILQQYPEHFSQAKTIVDLCSGAGLIAGMVAQQYSTKTIISLEYNPLAVQAQRKTWNKNNITNIDTRLSDLFSAINPKDVHEHQWILLSNPPYVPEEDKLYVKENNIEHEPSDAIFGGGKNGLDMFVKILNHMLEMPTPRIAVFELDPRNILLATRLAKNIFGKKLLQCKHKSDVHGWHRALILEFVTI